MVVLVDPFGHGISAAEVVLSFDFPEAVEVEMGALLGDNPVVAILNLLGDGDRIHVAAARRGPTSPPTRVEVLARIVFPLHANIPDYVDPVDYLVVRLVDDSLTELQDIRVIGLSSSYVLQ